MYTKSLRTILSVLFVGGVILGVLPGVSDARVPPPEEPIALQIQDDGGTAEVAVEWMTDWPGTANDRANWYYSANNLYNELLNAGWIGRFNWGNTNAWERDFKAAASGGNGDIDTVDLALIGTHGTGGWDSRYSKNLSAVSFTSNNDDTVLSPGEAYRYYGTNDLEWLAFDSCSVLRDDSMWYWHETFNGLHLMLGFANTMYVVYPGDGGEWGNQMRKKGWWIFGHDAKTVTQAWFSAVEDQQPSGVRARVLAEALDNYNDYMWGQGYVSPDYPNNGAYWYWDHVAGTPPPLQLAAAPTSMPIYQVVPRTVDEDYVRRIAWSFGFSTTDKVLAAPDHSAFYMAKGVSDTQQLRVDAFSGGYLYQDLGELWTKPELPRKLPPSGPRAQSIVDSFMQGRGESLAGFYGQHTLVTPTVEAEGVSVGLSSSARVAAAAPTTVTNYMVSYARALDIGDGQQASIVGPGARFNVYVGNDNQIVGLKGGWRDVQMATPQRASAQATAAVTVPIKTANQAWSDFEADPTIALAKAPLASSYDRAGKPDPTLAYYEQSLSITQTELIPAWVFVADLYTATTSLVASDVNLYVPAAADPLATLQANITQPATGIQIKPGESLNLSGAAGGGVPPYTYHWSSSVDGALGAGADLTTPELHADVHSGQMQANAITLLVVDANGQTATDTIHVTVSSQVYLPLVLK
ncbi:MAG: hypothetical protein JW850_11505 [Thermoflexales bacterium]|nr:hypothetical protein [Thermoflexales bacterium]